MCLHEPPQTDALIFCPLSKRCQLALSLALRRVGPPTWIGTLTFLVGAALIWLAFVNNWQQFVAVRAILGLLEARPILFLAYISNGSLFCTCTYSRPVFYLGLLSSSPCLRWLIDAPTFFLPQLGIPHILLVHPQGAAHPPGVFLYSVST